MVLPCEQYKAGELRRRTRLTNGGLFAAKRHCSEKAHCACAQPRRRVIPAQLGFEVGVCPSRALYARAAKRKRRISCPCLFYFLKRVYFAIAHLPFYRQRCVRVDIVSPVTSPCFGFVGSKYRTVTLYTNPLVFTLNDMLFPSPYHNFTQHS